MMSKVTLIINYNWTTKKGLAVSIKIDRDVCYGPQFIYLCKFTLYYYGCQFIYLFSNIFKLLVYQTSFFLKKTHIK